MRNKSGRRFTCFISFFPFGLVLQNVEQADVAFVACAGDNTVLDRLNDGAALFFGVGAFFVAARADVGLEFAERVDQILHAHKIKSLKVQHGKAWSVGQISAIAVVGQGIKLYRAGGVLSPLNAVGEVSCFQI